MGLVPDFRFAAELHSTPKQKATFCCGGAFPESLTLPSGSVLLPTNHGGLQELLRTTLRSRGTVFGAHENFRSRTPLMQQDLMTLFGSWCHHAEGALIQVVSGLLDPDRRRLRSACSLTELWRWILHFQRGFDPPRRDAATAPRRCLVVQPHGDWPPSLAREHRKLAPIRELDFPPFSNRSF